MVDSGWPLDELAQRTALALRRVALAPPNARVRDLPDPRTIRYYTTLGLLDRPLAYRGRVALYGPRHLLQLVAIKRLQAEGLPLSEVQLRLYALSDAELAAIASLPEGVVEATEASSSPRSSPPSSSPSSSPLARPPSRPFWKAPPMAPSAASAAPPAAPAAPPVAFAAPPVASAAPSAVRAEASEPVPLPALPTALRLTASALLILEPSGRPLTADDERALREAAAPLVRWLAARTLPPNPADES